MARRSDEVFPLPWERVRWSARPAFPGALVRLRTRYELTDFRIVVRHAGQTVEEIAVEDVARVELRQTRAQRVAGTSTVVLHSRRPRPPIALAHLRQGPQLALVLELLATDSVNLRLDGEFVRSALRDTAPVPVRPMRPAVVGITLLLSSVLIAVTLAHHDAPPPVAYASDDPIAPNGQRRSRADIVAFMNGEVMPFARRVLGPLKGGADKVSCHTCHGQDAGERSWKMPGVRALPEPDLRLAGLEQAAFFIDPQIRNAIYGYVAHEGKQDRAAYMRGVVVPGMAALLHRPPYDFTKSYGYNRARAALGCYHCHLVEKA